MIFCRPILLEFLYFQRSHCGSDGTSFLKTHLSQRWELSFQPARRHCCCVPLDDSGGLSLGCVRTPQCIVVMWEVLFSQAAWKCSIWTVINLDWRRRRLSSCDLEQRTEFFLSPSIWRGELPEGVWMGNLKLVTGPISLVSNKALFTQTWASSTVQTKNTLFQKHFAGLWILETPPCPVFLKLGVNTASHQTWPRFQYFLWFV